MKTGALRFAALLAVCGVLGGCVSQARVAARDLSAEARADPARLLVVGVRNVTPMQPGRAGATFRSYGENGGYSVSDVARRTLAAVASRYSLRKVAEWPIGLLQMQCAVFEMPPGASRDSLLSSLHADDRVELAQPLQSFATQTMDNTSVRGPACAAAPTERMNLRWAQQLAQGDGVRVAVIDTGLDAGHPDLAGRVEAEFNFVDASRRDFRLDRHGTAVAGVIAGRANAGAGILGTAPHARLLALKACWQLDPGGDSARCNSYTLAQALSKAIELHPQIINLSLSGPADPLLSTLLERATALGIIVVGAGNTGDAASGFPGSVGAVLPVVRTEAGPAPDNMLRAPGMEILTLAPGARYSLSSGDSIATAVISGITALLLSVEHPTAQITLRADQVRQLLRESTDTTGSGGDEQRVVNACRAVAALEGRNCPATAAVR